MPLSTSQHGPLLVIHGGAGTLLRSQMDEVKEKAYREALERSLSSGHRSLLEGGTAMDAVEAAVRVMEDSPLFNAGRGSVFTADGTHEMDASIMSGMDRAAGAVSGVGGIRNPISLARQVMERTEHVLLAGKGAESFARAIGAATEGAEYFHDDLRFEQWQSIAGTDSFQLDHSVDPEQKKGTVGAVALDLHGNIAAATSTGGMTNKRFGRVGDSPVIGSGTYARNETCAVSCTGSGEYFLKGVVAYDVSALMEYKGLSLQEACDEVIQKRLLDLGGDGGLIALTTSGQHAMVFNTEGMYRGVIYPNGKMETGIFGEG